MAISTPLGVKRICPKCNSRFYDLNKPMAHCPKCGHEHDPAVQLRPRRAKRAQSGDQDILLQHMAKMKANPPKKKEPDEDFGGAGAAVEPGLEEMEDMDAIQELEEIEEPEEEGEEEVLESGAAILVDKVEDNEVEEDEEEDEEGKAKRRAVPGQKKQKKK